MKNKRTINKKERGITLIALVVTIIVLLILAGVTINLALSNNGIIQRARDASERTVVADLIEKVKEDVVENEIGKSIGEGDKLREVLGKYFESVPEDLSNMQIVLTFKAEYGGYKTTLGEIFGNNTTDNGGKDDEIPIVTTAPITAVKKKTKYKDSNEDIAVIPEGFRVSDHKDSSEKYDEQTIDTGLVVKDGNNNEWVWIPVSDASKMYTKVEEGIAITGGSDKNIVSDVKTHYYSKTIFSDITRVEPNRESDRIGREPDILTNGDNYDCTNYETAGFSSIKDMAKKLVDDYKEMIESVEDNNGFYVGRYELTGNLTAPTEKEGKPIVLQDWYNLYKACKVFTVEGIVESRMIWGCQWDVMCTYIATRGDKKDINNSSEWGNHEKTDVKSSDGNTIIKASGSKKRLNTGETLFTMANKIYDVAGNCGEWTQEAEGTYCRMLRGGSYYYSGKGRPAKYRSAYTAGGNDPDKSTRPILYIK